MMSSEQNLVALGEKRVRLQVPGYTDFSREFVFLPQISSYWCSRALGPASPTRFTSSAPPPPPLVWVLHQESGAMAAGLWGAAALPVDSHIKSYSLHITQSHRQGQSSSVCGIPMRGGALGNKLLKIQLRETFPTDPGGATTCQTSKPGHKCETFHVVLILDRLHPNTESFQVNYSVTLLKALVSNANRANANCWLSERVD